MYNCQSVGYLPYLRREAVLDLFRIGPHLLKPFITCTRCRNVVRVDVIFHKLPQFSMGFTYTGLNAAKSFADDEVKELNYSGRGKKVAVTEVEMVTYGVG